jgi:hypothetical protein
MLKQLTRSLLIAGHVEEECAARMPGSCLAIMREIEQCGSKFIH